MAAAGRFGDLARMARRAAFALPALLLAAACEPQSQAEPQPEPEPQPQPELQPVPEPAPAKAARAAVLLPEVVRHAVVIHNPSSAELVGRCPDALGAAALELGNAVEVRLELPLGRWELQASLGERVWHLPLPLPAAAQRPERVELTIAPPPPPQAGLAWIAPGPALRGDVLGVGQEDERPARVVDIPGFWLATHETSNAESWSVMTKLRRIRSANPGQCSMNIA